MASAYQVCEMACLRARVLACFAYFTCLACSRAWRVRVLCVLYVLGVLTCFTCFACSRAWRALRARVLGVLGVLHKMECLACFKKWRAWCASLNAYN